MAKWLILCLNCKRNKTFNAKRKGWNLKAKSSKLCCSVEINPGIRMNYDAFIQHKWMTLFYRHILAPKWWFDVYEWKLCLAKDATNVHFPCDIRWIHSNTLNRGLLLEVFWSFVKFREMVFQRRRLIFTLLMLTAWIKFLECRWWHLIHNYVLKQSRKKRWQTTCIKIIEMSFTHAKIIFVYIHITKASHKPKPDGRMGHQKYALMYIHTRKKTV